MEDDGPNLELIEMERRRGARFARDGVNLYRRIGALHYLAERGLLTDWALTGAAQYAADLRVAFDVGLHRSSWHGPMGADALDDGAIERALEAGAYLSAVRRAVFGGDRYAIRLADDVARKSEIGRREEADFLKNGGPRQFEMVADWYQQHDLRAVDEDLSAMRLVTKEGWRLLAERFNPKMSERSFEAHWRGSGMEDVVQMNLNRREHFAAIIERERARAA